GGLIPNSQASIDCQASGTTMRFLTALVSIGHGQYVLDGTARMRQRPIGDLLNALRTLGGYIKTIRRTYDSNMPRPIISQDNT
ncbi:MAG: 3-phosphoshikimate 1-carboxyvinyltransferase, partial [Gammaproteobacteria bacterium]|nr:3-phosphoshikimate 1-carboxyvinyltransferase [Gammaproteobacteria bacterium]